MSDPDSSQPPRGSKYFLGVLKEISASVWNASLCANVCYAKVDPWKAEHIYPISRVGSRVTSLASSQMLTSSSQPGPATSRKSVTIESFQEGDLALFLPVRNEQIWRAFSVSGPRYFLDKESNIDHTRSFVVGCIRGISKCVSRSTRDPYGINVIGTVYYTISLEECY